MLHQRIQMLLGFFIALAIGSASVFALELDWHTVDGGGGTSAGGNFELSGSIGQADASPEMTGGNFAVVGGFWLGAGTVPCFADLNFDDTINVDDLLILIGAWGPSTAAADLNDDGTVNVDDLLDLIGAWGPCP